MKESLRNIGELIAEPSVAFERIKTEPKWGLAFMLFWLFSTLLAWAVAPYTGALIAEQMSGSNLSPEQRQVAETMAGVMRTVGMFIAPIFAMLWYLIVSAFLKLAVRFGNNDALTFRHIYAAIVHTGLISCLIAVVNTALLLVLRDVSDIKNAADMQMIPGLHQLFSSLENVKLLMFLSHINPLSVWLIAVMAIAVSILADIGKVKASVVAILIWLSGVALEVLAF